MTSAFPGVDDRFSVARPRLDVDRSRAGGDHDVFGLDRVGPAVARFHDDLGRALEGSLAVKKLHAVGFEERLDAPDVGVDDLGFELCDALGVDGRFGDGQAERARALDVADHFANV